MPDTIDAIKQRRSIRRFLPREVPREVVFGVLEAAAWAPSAHNSQPWRFILLQNAQIKRILAEKMAEAWAADLARDGVIAEEPKRIERKERFVNAPVLILACFTMEDLRKYPDEQRQRIERDLAVESLGAALENLFLARIQRGWAVAGIVRRFLQGNRSRSIKF